MICNYIHDLINSGETTEWDHLWRPSSPLCLHYIGFYRPLSRIPEWRFQVLGGEEYRLKNTYIPMKNEYIQYKFEIQGIFYNCQCVKIASTHTLFMIILYYTFYYTYVHVCMIPKVYIYTSSCGQPSSPVVSGVSFYVYRL